MTESNQQLIEAQGEVQSARNLLNNVIEKLVDVRLAAIEATDGKCQRLRSAAQTVVNLARNEGVAAGSNGQGEWGQAVSDLDAALKETSA